MKKLKHLKFIVESKHFITSFVVLLCVLVSTNLSAVTTKTVGATGADYTTISSALAYYSSADADGYVIVESTAPEG